MSSHKNQTSTKSTRPKTTREFIAETVRKAVQEQIDKGRTVGPTVLDRMLKNADNAWARHCQRVGIDIDTPLKSVPLPDDGSAVEYQRAEWCCVPKGQDQSNSVFMCKHGRVYTMLQQPATQQTIDASLQSAATNTDGEHKGRNLKNIKPSGSRGPYAKKGGMAQWEEEW